MDRASAAARAVRPIDVGLLAAAAAAAADAIGDGEDPARSKRCFETVEQAELEKPRPGVYELPADSPKPSRPRTR